MSIDPVPNELPGCRIVRVPVYDDARGRFVKPYSASTFATAGLPHDWAECFWSESRLGVVRGFHAQLPPAAYAKLLWIVSGATYTVLLDLRTDLPTYGTTMAIRLDASSGLAIFAPKGVAHAFQAVEDRAIVGYLVTSVHDPALDGGVRWDSVGVNWPREVTEISARDRVLPALADFKSPFRSAP